MATCLKVFLKKTVHKCILISLQYTYSAALGLESRLETFEANEIRHLEQCFEDEKLTSLPPAKRAADYF